MERSAIATYRGPFPAGYQGVFATPADSVLRAVRHFHDGPVAHFGSPEEAEQAAKAALARALREG